MPNQRELTDADWLRLIGPDNATSRRDVDDALIAAYSAQAGPDDTRVLAEEVLRLRRELITLSGQRTVCDAFVAAFLLVQRDRDDVPPLDVVKQMQLEDLLVQVNHDFTPARRAQVNHHITVITGGQP